MIPKRGDQVLITGRRLGEVRGVISRQKWENASYARLEEDGQEILVFHSNLKREVTMKLPEDTYRCPKCGSLGPFQVFSTYHGDTGKPGVHNLQCLNTPQGVEDISYLSPKDYCRNEGELSEFEIPLPERIVLTAERAEKETCYCCRSRRVDKQDPLWGGGPGPCKKCIEECGGGHFFLSDEDEEEEKYWCNMEQAYCEDLRKNRGI